MNRKIFFFIGITSFVSLCGLNLSASLLEEKRGASVTPWILSHSSDDFQPAWELASTLQKTRALFSSWMVIPDGVQEVASDCSLRFRADEGRVILCANGVRRTELLDGSIEFFDHTSSACCVVSPQGSIQATHEEASQSNACSVAVEDGGLVFKSNKLLENGKQRLNFLVRLRDGLSITFEYLDNEVILARESSGAVEVIGLADQTMAEILMSHSMIKLPSDAMYVAEGLVCHDGAGITCYVMDGMKFHVMANGLKLCFSAPTLQVQLEGLVANDRILTRWKFCSSVEKPYKTSRFEGVDILFDPDSGQSLLYVNLSTMQSGIFLYDGHGNYCKRSGIGGVRYGKVSPMLTYDGVTAAHAKDAPVGGSQSLATHSASGHFPALVAFA